MAAADPVVLVMGSGDRHFREYLLAAAGKRHPVWLFDPDPPTWQSDYVVGTTVLDLFDPATAVAAARDLAARRPVGAVVCWHEGVITAAAHVAEALGLPGPPVAAVAAARDKARARALYDRAGVSQPRHAVVRTVEEARAALDVVGLPLVSKPCGLGASQGVVRVDTEAELDHAIAVSQSATDRGFVTGPEVLLEEYVSGPEISVDAVVVDGEYRPFVLARKRVGFEPFFEEVGHVVDPDDPLLSDDKLLHLLAEAHRALGWRGGVTHSEVKLTDRGPVLVEVNGRLGGDLIPYLGELATGIDPAGVAVDLAHARAPDLERTRSDVVAVKFLYPPVDCRVREVQVPRPHDVPGLCEAVAIVPPGTELRLPPRGYVARYATLIARGGSEAECDAVLEEAARRTTLVHDPLPTES